MNKDVTKKRCSFPILVLFLLFVTISTSVFASENKFGIGIQAGISKLEGDWKNAKLNPSASLGFSINPNAYFSFGARFYYTELKTSADAERIDLLYSSSSKLKVITLPLELELRFSFAPFSKINPFGIVGGGYSYWDAKYEGSTLAPDGAKQRKYTPHFKAGGGIEIPLMAKLGLLLGADFRYVLTDKLDQIDSGDENDGIISIWSGLRYYPGAKKINDLDSDNIPDELDLEPQKAETINGYLDHDGKPEAGLPSKQSLKGPVVLHKPVFKAQAGKDILIRAKIICNTSLRPPALLYRMKGQKNWKVQELQNVIGENYITEIKRTDIHSNALEYCIVAVDKDVSGVGFAGSPGRPIQVTILPNGKSWKTVGGVITVAACGTASYIILRKQSN